MTNHCTFKQCQALKEIGFKESVRDVYNKNGFIQHGLHNMNYNQGESTRISAPTRSEVLQWAREKHKLFGFVAPNDDYTEETPEWWIGVLCLRTKKTLFGFDGLEKYNYHPTYNQAEDALIDKFIELFNKQQS